MKINIKSFLKKSLTVFAFAIVLSPAISGNNLPGNSDIGDFGNWSTPHNQQLFTSNLTDDITAFGTGLQTKILASDYVPIEARVGRAFIGGLSFVAGVLDKSLVPFISIFLAIILAFWIILEAYQMMTGTSDIKKLAEEVVKKVAFVGIWIWIIANGPAQIFMWIMGPVITIGTYLSDLILNSVANASGAQLPDTCAAIHKYISANHTGISIIDTNTTADLLCVPTRLSGFFYTAVSAGFGWMLAGIGTSAFTFTAGAVFVVIFLYNIWKFALMALGVIADLFLGLMMLPFTAIAETFGNTKSSYTGIAGNVFNAFTGLFKAESLSAQIQRFINAAIYFVSLSIVIAVCAAILSGVIDSNLAGVVPHLDNDGFMIVLIVGCLVAYLATKAGDIAKNIGGSINDSMGTTIGNDVKGLLKNSVKTGADWYKIVRGKK